MNSSIPGNVLKIQTLEFQLHLNENKSTAEVTGPVLVVSPHRDLSLLKSDV